MPPSRYSIQAPSFGDIGVKLLESNNSLSSYTTPSSGGATINFAGNGTLLATVPLFTTGQGGSAIYTTSLLAAGSHTITAVLTPSVNYTSSSATLTQVVTLQPISPSLTPFRPLPLSAIPFVLPSALAPRFRRLELRQVPSQS